MMTQLIDYLIGILGYVMQFCYQLTQNYGLSILLFTLLTKLLLFPLSILTQINSIRMIRLQPELDQLKTKYIDDKDKLTDEQLALYKKYHYNPFLDTLPLLLQIPIVLGLVGVIYRPLRFVLNIDTDVIDQLHTWLTDTCGITDAGNMYELKIMELLQAGTPPPSAAAPDMITKITEFSMMFLKIDLGRTPSLHDNPILLLIPLLAGVSAWVLCAAQNRLNVLQLAQGKLNKILTTVFLVAFSTYFACIVPCGVGLYWIAGNLFAIPMMLLTNLLIPPKKYVDYARLQEMRTQKLQKEAEFRQYRKREKADYKRFFAQNNMQLMFYSEQNGFYKYFSGMIDYLCQHTDITIHYVTSDPNDRIFDDTREQIQSYYIASDRYLVPLFMKLEADMCVMTMPDLEKYHIKRSRVRDDVEYVFACHGMGSISLYRKGALDWFDTILCPNADQAKEIRAYETLYDTPQKLLVEAGYPFIDQLIADYQKQEHPRHEIPQIIIAPSWQKDNIIDLCAEQLLDVLSESGFSIILRPHPQQVRHEPERFSMMKERFQKYPNIEIQTDFSGNNPIMESDLLITDWSDIAWEYAFATKRPVLYIDTPMKVMNLEYEQIGIEPINKTLRTQIGEVLSLERMDTVCEVIRGMLQNKEEYSERITRVMHEHLYNVGSSSEICGRYISKSLQNRL